PVCLRREIAHRSRLRSRRQKVVPQLFARSQIERTEVAIHRAADEDETALGDDRTGRLWDAHGQTQLDPDAERTAFVGRTDRLVPDHRARLQIDDTERAV